MGNQQSSNDAASKEDTPVPWPWYHAMSHILDNFDEGMTYSFGSDGGFSTSPSPNSQTEKSGTQRLPMPRRRQDPAELTPYLYLTSEFMVRNYTKSYLTEGNPLGITHVLSTNSMCNESKKTLQKLVVNAGMKHYLVPGEDEEDYDMIRNHWEECLAFLKSVKEDDNSKVLVHCVAGINRSGLIATAALVVLERMPLLDAVKLVKSKRGYVLSNNSFRKQLACLAAKEGLLGEKLEGYSDQPPSFESGSATSTKKVLGLFNERFG